MEAAALQDVQSSELETPKVQLVLKSLESSVAEAKEARDATVFSNPALRRSLEIVQDFLRLKKRVCYGGMAINAHLPDKYKFYDFSKTLPDYDFFTPDQDGDIKFLVRRLRQEGLPNIEVKFGIHEGTTKIFVDYNSIADVTSISNEFYNKLYSDSIVEHGIHYTDANFLRMAMYLELSRPMGEVERWDKVFKRLYLLNNAVPPSQKGCKIQKVNGLGSIEREVLLRYISMNSLVYASPDLETLYKSKKESDVWWKKSLSPIIAYSADMYKDINAMKRSLQNLPGNTNIRIYKWKGEDEFLPTLLGLVVNGEIRVLLVQQVACHAYNSVLLNNESVLRVASLDTLITLYYSLSYIKGLEGIAKYSFDCLANRLVAISRNIRDEFNKSRFPYFPLQCMGHQASKETLLKAKKQRIEEFRRAKKNMTRKKRN